MQIKSLRIKSYRSWRVNDISVNPIAQERLKALEPCWALKAEGYSEKTLLEVVGISRPTFYRWQKAYRERGIRGLIPQSSALHTKRKPEWSKQLEQQVLHIKNAFRFGENKRWLPCSNAITSAVLQKALLVVSCKNYSAKAK